MSYEADKAQVVEAIAKKLMDRYYQGDRLLGTRDWDAVREYGSVIFEAMDAVPKDVVLRALFKIDAHTIEEIMESAKLMGYIE